MKDAMGQTIEIGDTVVLSTYAGGALKSGEVIGFTPYKVRVRIYVNKSTLKDSDYVAIVKKGGAH